MPICMHVCTSMCIFRFIISQILCQDIQITTNLTQVIKFRKSHSLKLYILANNAKFILSVEINTEFFLMYCTFFCGIYYLFLLVQTPMERIRAIKKLTSFSLCSSSWRGNSKYTSPIYLHLCWRTLL